MFTIFIKRRTIITLLLLIMVIIIFILTGKYANKKIMQASAKNYESQYKIYIDVEESKLYLYKNKELEKIYKCAGGKLTTPSPIGTWTIISKAKWGEGFGGSWLGFNVPWGKFGIHGTTEIYSVGWSSSHGCIRMNNNEVAELYKIIPIGTKVIIVDGVYGEFGRGFRYLKSGMYGSDVLAIQKKLQELGYFNGYANGKFGAETEKAVQKYCKEKGLYIRKIIDEELQKNMGFQLID